MNYQKERIIIFFLLIAIAALSLKSCFRQAQENATLKDVIEVRQDSTTYWRDKYGTEHAERQLAVANLNSLQVLYSKIIDSLSVRLSIKEKAIQGITAAGTIIAGTVIPKLDTIHHSGLPPEYRFSYKDKWITLFGSIGKESSIDYQLRDSIVFTTYAKRIGLFKKAVYIDGFSLNPHSKISGITGIRIDNSHKTKISVGPYVGYGFDGISWQPTAGISIQYNLLKF